MENLGKFTLDNGLELYYQVIPGKNFVIGEFSVGSGSALEPYNKRGLAHLVEHMTFFGSRNYPSQQKQQEAADSLGLDLNASTSERCIIYPAEVAKDQIVGATKLLTDIMFRPFFRKPVIDKQKKIIANEARMFYDYVSNQSNMLFNQTFFRGTPLEELAIGREDHIATIDKRDISDYHRKHFVPSNVKAYIYGGLDESTIEAVKAELSILAKKPKPEEFSSSMPFMTGVERVDRQLEGIRQCYGNIAFRTCTKNHEDVPAAMITEELLNGSGKSGLMTQIRHKLDLVYGIGANIYAKKGMGYARVNFSCGPDDLERTLAETREMLVRIRPSQVELDNVKKRVAENYKKIHETPSSMLRLFVYEQEEGHPYTDTLAKLDSVTREEVVAFAEKYFEDKPYQITVIRPKIR